MSAERRFRWRVLSCGPGPGAVDCLLYVRGTYFGLVCLDSDRIGPEDGRVVGVIAQARRSFETPTDALVWILEAAGVAELAP